MFTPQGPTLRELTVQALSSVERGYDLLAPSFDHTPFRTPDAVLDAVADALPALGPFQTGLDLCCGTGAGIPVLRRVCERRVVGLDFSAGMLAQARAAHAARPPGAAGTDRAPEPAVDWVRADALAMPFSRAFDVVTSFGAFGHFLPRQRPALFSQTHAALRPGGVFAFPIVAPPRVGSRWYWLSWGFDAAMRVRNAVWRPRFVMYYRTFGLADVLEDLTGVGFAVETRPLSSLGTRPDGSPRCRLVVARRPG
ncbi:class I SAM-dependent methyltransferase [Streptomyces sp. 4N509B]|uniref:class I SAM-dependent methyltransferase n=1 Tax=Streptomyces sp. 4N509B TaxID=3457413 RepID=UPI003FD06E3E